MLLRGGSQSMGGKNQCTENQKNLQFYSWFHSSMVVLLAKDTESKMRPA